MDALASIPPRELPVSVRAPGKCILFGEHAVVHGAPELLLAVDLETQILLRSASAMTLNADPAAAAHHAYFRRALEVAWPSGRPLNVRTVSRIPRSAGLGSSAAFCAAFVGALGALTGGIDRVTLAQRAFDVEHGAQGRGSPGDTSASAAGGYLAVNDGAPDPLWTIHQGERHWTTRRVEDPGWVWVVADTGIPRATGEVVGDVTARLSAPDGPELLAEFTEVARDGIRAVEHGDRASVAELMRRNQELLVRIGVSHPRLEALLAAAQPAAEAAKITGAGRGGSIVALPRPGQESELVRRLARAGGLPFSVRASPRGTELVDPSVPE